MDRVLVIIATYNGMVWLERCLDSVVNSSIPLDAYIVDNGSTDGSQEFITTNYPQFTFYQSPTNSGFGAANNIAMEYAIEHNYDYVYLLNQDAWVMPETIATLIEQQRLNPEYGILSPLQTNAEMTRLDRNFERDIPRNTTMLSDSIFGNHVNVYEVSAVMAAHWLISKECLHTIGLFSPVFDHYGEDNNYTDRLKYHKFKVGVVPFAFGVHDRESRKLEKNKDVYFSTMIRFLICTSNINYPFYKSAISGYMRVLVLSIRKAVQYKDVFIAFQHVFCFILLFKIYKDRQSNKNIAYKIINE